MRLVLLVSPFMGTDILDTAGIDTEAQGRGHDAVVIDASRRDLAAAVADVLPADVAICRFANQPTAIEVARELAAKLPLICSGESIDIARNQVRTLRTLSERGLPTPASIIADRRSNAREILSQLGTPVVCKKPLTCGGAGVWLASDERELSSALDRLADGDELVTQHFHAEACGQDMRILVVGSQVVACIWRTAAPGDFRANLFQGATYRPYVPSALEARLAIAAADVVGLDVAGVDLLVRTTGPVIVEVNPKPGHIGMDGAATAVVDLAERRARSTGQG